MGIQVECPNGHIFKVKEKYAGKKGICPLCTGKVSVQVPDTLSAITAPAKSKSTAAGSSDDMSESVLDDSHGHPKGPPSGKSGSLLNSSLIRDQATCKRCGAKVPMWFASCSACGEFMDGS